MMRAGAKKGDLKALVDGLAKQAADGGDAGYLPKSRHVDAVQVHDETGGKRVMGMYIYIANEHDLESRERALTVF